MKRLTDILNISKLMKTGVFIMLLCFLFPAAVFAGEACGANNPDGCPEGQKCYKIRYDITITRGGIAPDMTVHDNSVFECHTDKEIEKLRNPGLFSRVKALSIEKVEGSKGEKNTYSVTSMATGVGNRSTVDEEGNIESYLTLAYGSIEIAQFIAKCNIAKMQELYQGKCYSCVIIKTLMETFLNACSKAYDITSEAGVKLLVLGALVWMAFFVMKNVSSLSNIEPGAMMNTLTVFLFKVMVAYILITSGLGVLIKYTINPLLTAGADFGIAFMSVTSDISGAPELNANYAVTVPTISASDGGAATEIVSSDVMNRIMFFAQNLDKNVSTNLVIGHAMTCWSMNGGAWDFSLFKMVNLWLWFCGALIWFVGFMLTLGIGYYLLDISFKLGFAIMALPVVIGLWPFNVTKGKVTAVISIMLKAAGTFVFLALTTTYALAMINVALRDVPTLFAKIEAGDAIWISNTFDLTGPYFLIILFVYLYSMKLISSTVSDYVDKFFKDSVFGGADPMHGKLTQMTDFAKQQAMRPVKWAGGKASDAVKKQATEGAAKAGKFVRGLFKGKAGGKGLMSAGKGLSATGLGAIVGVPMMIAGAAVYGAGKGAEVAGKVTQKAGKAMQKGGKAMKKVGEKMEKAGEKMEKMGNKLKFGDEKAPEPENKDNSSEGESSRPEEQNKPEKPDNGNKPENGK